MPAYKPAAPSSLRSALFAPEVYLHRTAVGWHPGARARGAAAPPLTMVTGHKLTEPGGGEHWGCSAVRWRPRAHEDHGTRTVLPGLRWNTRCEERVPWAWDALGGCLPNCNVFVLWGYGCPLGIWLSSEGSNTLVLHVIGVTLFVQCARQAFVSAQRPRLTAVVYSLRCCGGQSIGGGRGGLATLDGWYLPTPSFCLGGHPICAQWSDLGQAMSPHSARTLRQDTCSLRSGKALWKHKNNHCCAPT